MYGRGGGSGNPITGPPDDYRLGGARPIRLMLGTGTTAVEVWRLLIAVTGTITQMQLPQSASFQTVASWTADQSSGSDCYVGIEVNWAEAGQLRALRITRNGTEIVNPPNTTEANQSAATSSPVVKGDVFTFQAASNSSTSERRLIATAEWRITE